MRILNDFLTKLKKKCASYEEKREKTERENFGHKDLNSHFCGAGFYPNMTEATFRY